MRRARLFPKYLAFENHSYVINERSQRYQKVIIYGVGEPSTRNWEKNNKNIEKNLKKILSSKRKKKEKLI